jgi:excinuclease UvrABC ATPase subunit
VFVADINLADITALPIDRSLAHFDTLKLAGWRGEVAAKIVKEIRERLNFLVDVGLNYLTLIARPIRCPAARRNASVWPARSVPAWSA